MGLIVMVILQMIIMAKSIGRSYTARMGVSGLMPFSGLADGGYVMAGKTVSFGAGLGDVWVLKLDSKGMINNCDFIVKSATVVDSALPGYPVLSVVSPLELASEDSAAIPQR